MKTPALFKAMNLGDGFGDDYDFSFGAPVGPDWTLVDLPPVMYERNDIFDPASKYSLIDPNEHSGSFLPPWQEIIDPGFTIPFNPNDYVDIFDSEPGQVIDISGNVVTQTNEPLIPVAVVQQIALNNPGKEAEAIAKTLQVTAPDWTKQFKTSDELIRAAAGLYNTAKAVITGKPIPPVIRSPNIQTINRPTTQSSLNSTNMLLIGGVALAAILLLRKK